MEIRILGPLEVVGADGQSPVPGGRARALLAILALQPGRVVSTDTLLDLLWGASPPATARTKLHGLVSKLRKTLSAIEPGEIIETKSPGYALDVSPDDVDALRFERMVRRASQHGAEERIEMLEAALDLWRGPILADFVYEPFAQPEITTYEGLRLMATEERIAAALEIGRHATVLTELDALLAEHPFREQLRQLAMLAHYRFGNQRRALQIAHEAHITFREELGVEPGPGLQSLERAILDHDPQLQVSQESASGAIAQDRWLAESRKTVTVAFIDVALPTGRESDPETERVAARGRHEAIHQSIRRHEGTVQGSIGGVIVAVFGLPIAHEDDALRAVRTAAELTSDTASGLRIGINTGEMVVGEAPWGSSLAGVTSRIATQLQQAAEPGEVLLGDETRRLVGAAAQVEPSPGRVVDDSGGQVTAWTLVGLDGSDAASTRQDAEWVGRADELTRLRLAVRTAEDSAQPVLLTVIGDAGIGKSRLAAEFTSSLPGSHRVLYGRCPAYGDGATFWPLRQIVREAAASTDPEDITALLHPAADADRIAHQLAGAIGSSEHPERPDDLFPAVRRFLEVLTSRTPLVVVIDDLHWAQPTFIELIDYLADASRGSLLLLCLARPEFLEMAPSWAEEHSTVTLPPLDSPHVEQLVSRGLIDNGLPYHRASELLELAGGNPLFVEQMLAALVENDELTIPTSLRALLAARLDSIGPAERDLVRAASVWGLEFQTDDLAELVPAAMRSTVAAHLGELVRTRLLMHSRDGVYAFRHVLIQLVAYGTVTKDTRARLHERAAQVLGSAPERTVTEIEEVIGYHLEQAFRFQTELGIDDAHTRTLAGRAGESLTRAGTRAFRRLDAMAAESLLARALHLLPHEHPDRTSATRYLVESYQVMGRHRDAARLLDDLLDDIEGNNDDVLDAFLRLERVWTLLSTGPDPLTLAEIEAETLNAESVFAEAGYFIGLAQTGRVHWHVHLRRGEMAEMEEAAYQSLKWARMSSSGRERLGAEWGVSMALEAGPRPVQECIERCNRIRGEIENPGLFSTLAHLNAMHGDFVTARNLISEAIRILREHVRAKRPMAQVLKKAADIELLAGDREAAVRMLQDSLDRNREQGEPEPIAEIAAALARLLVRDGGGDAALELVTLARQQAPNESVTAQASWRSAAGLVAAARGERTEAEAFARRASAIAPDDMLTLRAGVLMDLGKVLARLGKHTESLQVGREAVRLFERKGNRSGAATARTVVGRGSPAM